MWIGQPSEDKMESKQTDALKQELGSQSEAVPEQELDGVVAQSNFHCFLIDAFCLAAERDVREEYLNPSPPPKVVTFLAQVVEYVGLARTFRETAKRRGERRESVNQEPFKTGMGC